VPIIVDPVQVVGAVSPEGSELLLETDMLMAAAGVWPLPNAVKAGHWEHEIQVRGGLEPKGDRTPFAFNNTRETLQHWRAA